MRCRIKIALLVISVMLLALLAGGEKKQKKLSKVESLNYGIFNRRVFHPEYGSPSYRFYFESLFNGELYYEAAKEKGVGEGPYRVITDKIKAPEEGHKNKAKVTLSHLYTVKDSLWQMSSIFKFGNDVCFFLRRGVKQGDVKYNGIYKITKDKWYELITGTHLDYAVDLGNNRVIGCRFMEPGRLYGFKQSFRDEFSIELPGFRMRQELHRLSYDTFLFHNFRLKSSDCAVEIYGIDGKRIKECFNYSPYDFKQPHQLPLRNQTVLTTDRKGHFYIAFQYPLNPYRIWKYDSKGKKIKVFGNYFVSADVYESPEDWIMYTEKEINRYGVKRVYVINKLLVDGQGRLLVFFSENRNVTWFHDRFREFRRDQDKDEKKGKGAKSIYPGDKRQRHNYFIDIYSPDGEFIGRTPFKHGFPELVDRGIIYSRVKLARDIYEITAVRLTLD